MSNLLIIEKLMIRLLQTNVFMASILSQMRRISTDKIPTEAVAIRNGRIEFMYNPKFLETLTLDEAVAVLTHECMPAKTFLTGVNKFVEDVKVGDKVLSHKGKFTKVTHIMKRWFEGDIYTVKPLGLSTFQLTDNHPLLTIEYRRHAYEEVYLKPKFVQVKDLIDMKMENTNKGHYLLFPKLKLKSFSEILDLKPYLLCDYNTSYKNLEIKLDEELAWVLGYYTADGSLSRGQLGAISMRWSGHATKDIPHFERVLNWLSRYGYNGTIVDDKRSENSTSLQSRSSILGRAFEDWCGHGAYNKHIPDFILYNKDKSLIKAFLNGFLAGDGCIFTSKRNYTSKIFNTVSPTLAYQLHLAILNLGEAATLSYNKDNAGGLEGIKTNKGLFTIFWRPSRYKCAVKEFENYYGVRVGKISKTPFKGYVYNLETKSHTYTIQNLVSHNCGHVIHSHLTRMRDEYKENPALANISQDMCVNAEIQNLPKGACTVDSITKEFAAKGIKLNLKADDTAENYYKELNKHSNKMEIKADGEGNFDVTIKDPNGKVIGKFKVKAICDNKPNSESEGGDIPELAKEVIRQAIKEAVDQTNKQQGHLPAGMEEAINEWLKPPTISWKQLLKKFIAASIKAGHKMSWKRPNRRFGEQQKGSIPDRMIQITVAVDTSGSIGEEDFQAFIAEMRAIQACYKGTVTVLECDADIQKEYKLTKYSKIDTKFRGRGGTSFRPVFEHIQKKKIKTDVLCYFTDGYGDQDGIKKPPYPVIWVSTTDYMKFPWGWVISLTKNPDKKKLSLTGK